MERNFGGRLKTSAEEKEEEDKWKVEVNFKMCRKKVKDRGKQRKENHEKEGECVC